MNRSDAKELALSWSSRLSLTRRILAINIFALAVLAGGFFYIDSYRSRLIDEQMEQANENMALLGHALNAAPPRSQALLIANFAEQTKSRIRVYDPQGAKKLDSFELAEPTYVLKNPDNDPLPIYLARLLDKTIDFIVRAPNPPAFNEPEDDQMDKWPEAVAAFGDEKVHGRFRFAADRTPVISAAMRTEDDKWVALSTMNASDVTEIVRAERSRLGIVILAVTLISVLLSLFLARTIVRPLRHLAHAAVRVRLGRAREVTVPRLPSRNDEIGLLARSLSDMSIALREKIDATEAFAADVAHELKNPLASLRSALETLERVEDPKQQKQLVTIASDDVRRIDRLVSDISEASRVDAELARTSFERVDLGDMIEQLLSAREERNTDDNVRIAFAKSQKGSAIVMGDDNRLVRVIENLLDNAISFSPPNGLIEISTAQADNQVITRVIDNGPGVPAEQREAIFSRFHSDRPDSEDFGKHSGLGLAISRTIIEGHQGRIDVSDRQDGKSGASFEISLPFAD